MSVVGVTESRWNRAHHSTIRRSPFREGSIHDNDSSAYSRVPHRVRTSSRNRRQPSSSQETSADAVPQSPGSTPEGEDA